ncbi:MurR/RpiR family transcriptional regulator [Candidatus Mycoplasma pogonae]
MNIINVSPDTKFTNIENLILRFIETKPTKFIELTIKEVAETLYISIGAVTHFVKKTGFKSYKDLRKHVVEQLKYQKPNNIYDINDDIENVNLFYVHSIEKTIGLLDVNVVNNAVNQIIQSRKIITFGIGSSAMAAGEMANALRSLFLNSVNAFSIHDIATWIDDKNGQDMVIIFSKTMSSKELQIIFQLLQKHHIYVLLITNNKEIVGDENVDVIHFDTLEQDKRLFSLSSKISELLVSDVLLMKIHARLNIKKGNFYSDFQKHWRKKN